MKILLVILTSFSVQVFAGQPAENIVCWQLTDQSAQELIERHSGSELLALADRCALEGQNLQIESILSKDPNQSQRQIERSHISLNQVVRFSSAADEKLKD